MKLIKIPRPAETSGILYVSLAHAKIDWCLPAISVEAKDKQKAMQIVAALQAKKIPVATGSLKKTRTGREIRQVDISDFLNISRTSYINLERSSHLTLEVVDLCSIYFDLVAYYDLKKKCVIWPEVPQGSSNDFIIEDPLIF